MSTSPADSTEIGVDLAEPLAHVGAGPQQVFRRLREERPVAWHPPMHGRRGFWTVTRHDGVTAVCRDAVTFNSAGGNVMETLLATGDSAAGRMLAVSDGPRHAAIRRLLRPTLAPDALSTVRVRIEDRTRCLVRAARRTGTCDFAREVAAHIPLHAICDLLGVPEADRSLILRHTSAALSSERLGESTTVARAAKGQLLLYFAKLAADRRGRDADPNEPDLIGRLVNGDVDGSPLTVDEVVLNCYSLILGGDETARLAMISSALAFARHPDQWQAWRDGLPVEPAVQELLRWTTPAMHIGRTATTAVELGGREIRHGDAVVAWLNSANADTDEFREPERLDLTRMPNRHVSFAYGAHFCLGAYLARVEIAALLEALREEVRTLDEAGPPVPLYSNFLHGYTSLPLRLR